MYVHASVFVTGIVLGTGFIMKQASYEINCCGVLDQWLIEADNPDSGTETVFFQVWRPTASNDVHELVGQFSYGVSEYV